MKRPNLVIITLGAFLLFTVSTRLGAGVEVETPKDADKSAQAELLIT